MRHTKLLTNSALLFIFSLSGCFLVESTAPSRIDSGPEIIESSPGILSKYRAFHVAPVQVLKIEGDVLRRVDEREVTDLAEEFRSKIIRQLDNKYTSFPQPASGVALLNVSISDVSTNYALLQLRPGMVIPNSMRGGAAIEAKFVDSVSGKEILTFRDTEQGKREGFLSGLGKWDGVKKAFDDWASELGQAVN